MNRIQLMLKDSFKRDPTGEGLGLVAILLGLVFILIELEYISKKEIILSQLGSWYGHPLAIVIISVICIISGFSSVAKGARKIGIAAIIINLVSIIFVISFKFFGVRVVEYYWQLH